jgi:hypothetical protein
MHYLAILATFKNEAMILKEWVEHHKWQGFDHIYLINNNSDDNYKEVLKEFIKDGYVTLYNLPGKYEQVNNYNIVYQQIKHTVRWLAICDIDEYWFTPIGTANEYMKELDKQDIHLLYTRWYAYGSSGYDTQPVSIRESFIKRAEEVGSIKSIVRTSNANILNIHQHSLTENTTVKIDYKDIRLNHYRVMSREYFTKTKLVRGSPSGYPSLDICDTYRDEEYFRVNDVNDVEDNTLANLVRANTIPTTTAKPTHNNSSHLLKQLAQNNRVK